MVVEDLKLIDKNEFDFHWKNFLNSINLSKILDQDEKDIENSLNILDISKINHIFCLISFHVTRDNTQNHIYSSKFFLFEFFCNYLLNRLEKEDFLNKNFIPIMQQALLNKSDNYNEKNYYDVIIDVITKYFLKNRNFSFEIILPMINKSANKKNFLGLFDSTDPQKKIIPPVIIQEKIADYLFFLTKNSKYISDIITDPDPESEKEILERKKIYKKNICPDNKIKYNNELINYIKNLDNYYLFEINSSSDRIELFIRPISAKTQETENPKNYNYGLTFDDIYGLNRQKKRRESTELMEKIVNIVEKRVLKFLESSENKINVATETSEFSRINYIPKIITNKSYR